MKILLVDATNNFLRNYAVVPTLNSIGEPNGGVIGFLRSLAAFARVHDPDSIILVWDGPGGSVKRKAINKNYKEGRKPTRLNRNYDFENDNPAANKIKQRIRLAEYLLHLPVTQLVIPDIEADDVIGYLVKYYGEDEKIIVSNDKDFYQLIDDKTTMYKPTKKEIVDIQYVVDNFNIYPKNFVLARAVVGDPSDKLKGVRGIGLKNILKYFSFLTGEEKVSLEQILEYSRQNGEKYERFVEAEQVIIDNHKIMQLEIPVISQSSIQKIKEGLEKRIILNATGFRVRLYEDGITTMGDNFFQPFRTLKNKDKK